jgi:hypothetical protein
MNEVVQGIWANILYRSLVAVVGLAFAFLGYRLFRLASARRRRSGTGASDLEAIHGETRLTLRNAAPGSLFGLFGASLIVVSLVWPASFSKRSTTTESGTPWTEQGPVLVFRERELKVPLENAIAAAGLDGKTEKDRDSVRLALKSLVTAMLQANVPVKNEAVYSWEFHDGATSAPPKPKTPPTKEKK